MYACLAGWAGLTRFASVVSGALVLVINSCTVVQEIVKRTDHKAVMSSLELRSTRTRANISYELLAR